MTTDIEQFVIESGSDDLATFGGTWEGGAHIQQIPDEIGPAIGAILESGATIGAYLEIGSAAGGTAYLVNHFFQPRTIVLIDDNKHHKAGLRPLVLTGIERNELIGLSEDEAVIDALRMMETEFDLVMIDGNHNYAPVKLDVMTYGPFVRPGGYLLLHDSAMAEWGVARVARELKSDPKWLFVGEYLSAAHHRPLGVALFRKVAQ